MFLWLLTTRYLPPVLAAFGAFEPMEHQLAAALSFHYNTGAITRATGLKRFLAGDAEAARKAILEWRRPPEILPRRRKERDLFFDAKWSGDGKVAVYEISKPGYRPMKPQRTAIEPFLAGLLVADGLSDPLRQGSLRATPTLLGDDDDDDGNWFDRIFTGEQ